jgi:uncharacterized membrane protein (Fun14 family)
LKETTSISEALLLNVGGGVIAGIAAGYAFKRLSRILLFFVGTVILLLYILMKAGYISVHWDAITHGLSGGTHSMTVFLQGMVQDLSLSLIGFGGGFLMGLRLR